MLFFLLLLLSLSTPICHGFGPKPKPTPKTCWLDEVWDHSEIQVMNNIQYGAAFNNATKAVQDLYLDAYLPPATDNRTARPAVVVIHGGSFDAGDKGDAGEIELSLRLASTGYAVVSINYRLTGDYWDWTTEQMILDAAEDARAAVRWVRSVAEDQKIDTDRVSIIGESAGAWTALFVGYVGKAKHEGNSGNPGYPSQPNGIVSISGELKGQGFCKSVHPKPTGCQVDVPNDETNDLTGADGQPPLLMLHGTEDTIVPYVNGKAVYDRAQSVGLVSSFISLQGAPHVPWDVIFNQSDYWQQTMQNMWIGLNLANAEAPAGCTPQTIRTFADGSDASTKDGGIAATAAAAATAARDNATALRVIRTAQSRATASANCSGEVASAYIDTNVGGPCATTDRSGARLIDYGYSKVGLTLPATAAGLCKSGSAASAANFSNLATGWVVGDVACFSGSDGAAGAAAVGGFVRGGAIGAGSLVICTGASYERVDRTSTNYNYWASHFVGTRRLCS